MKSSENNFIFLPAFYMIMCIMKAPKNFEKIAIMKIWELVSFWGVKAHFAKLHPELSAFSGMIFLAQVVAFDLIRIYTF